MVFVMTGYIALNNFGKRRGNLDTKCGGTGSPKLIARASRRLRREKHNHNPPHAYIDFGTTNGVTMTVHV
jgi:hypothetical protein